MYWCICIAAQTAVDLQLINAALMSHGEDATMEEDDDDEDDAGVEASVDLSGKTVPQLKECLSDCKTRRFTLRQQVETLSSRLATQFKFEMSQSRPSLLYAYQIADERAKVNCYKQFRNVNCCALLKFVCEMTERADL